MKKLSVRLHCLVDGIKVDLNPVTNSDYLCHTRFDIMQLRSANSAYVCFE